MKARAAATIHSTVPLTLPRDKWTMLISTICFIIQAHAPFQVPRSGDQTNVARCRGVSAIRGNVYVLQVGSLGIRSTMLLLTFTALCRLSHMCPNSGMHKPWGKKTVQRRIGILPPPNNNSNMSASMGNLWRMKDVPLTSYRRLKFHFSNFPS